MGANVGDFCLSIGCLEGRIDSAKLGAADITLVGDTVGTLLIVGGALPSKVGATDGEGVGSSVGKKDGDLEGLRD